MFNLFDYQVFYNTFNFGSCVFFSSVKIIWPLKFAFISPLSFSVELLTHVSVFSLYSLIFLKNNCFIPCNNTPHCLVISWHPILMVTYVCSFSWVAWCFGSAHLPKTCKVWNILHSSWTDLLVPVFPKIQAGCSLSMNCQCFLHINFSVFHLFQNYRSMQSLMHPSLDYYLASRTLT